MTHEEIIKTLTAERNFLDSQLRKLSAIIHNQEEEISDLRTANQDLKFQLIELHQKLNNK